MNQEKRHIVYQKVKNYVKYRKKDLRFPFHPSFERSTDLRLDLKMLKEYDYDLGQVRQSDIWCQRHDIDEPIGILTPKINEFWDILDSDEWHSCSSIRVCEGELLDLLLESLYFLQRAGALIMYRMARFDEAEFLCPKTANRSSNSNSPNYKHRPVKITFTFFGNKECDLGSDSVFSQAPQSFHINEYAYDDESLSGSDENQSSTSLYRWSSLYFRMSKCHSETGESGSAKASGLLSQKSTTKGLTVHSDTSISAMTSFIKPLETFRRIGTCSRARDRTSTSSLKKGSIHFRPSLESMEKVPVVFEDDRYLKAGKKETQMKEITVEIEPSEGKESSEYTEESVKINLLHLQQGINLGVTRRREVLLISNNSDAQSRHCFSRSPARMRVVKVPHTSMDDQTKMHPDRGALIYGRKFNTEHMRLGEALHLGSKQPPKTAPPAIYSSETQHNPVIKPRKLRPRKYVWRPKEAEIAVRRKTGIDIYHLNLSHSIDQLRLGGIKRKKSSRPLKSAEVIHRKYISNMLEPQLEKIYKKKGLLKDAEPHPMHLLSGDSYIEDKIERVKQFHDENEATKKDESPQEPRFPMLDREAFQRKLLEASRHFLIRKEQVTCSHSAQTITSVTFNRIINCSYGQVQTEEESDLPH